MPSVTCFRWLLKEGFTYFARHPKHFHDSMNRPKMEFIAYIYIYKKKVTYRNYYNLDNKTVIILMVLLESKTEKRNSLCDGANKMLVLHVRIRCGSLSITTIVSLLANEFDV